MQHDSGGVLRYLCWDLSAEAIWLNAGDCRSDAWERFWVGVVCADSVAGAKLVWDSCEVAAVESAVSKRHVSYWSRYAEMGTQSDT